MKCLVVVAHPDDEIIWMGGLMLRHPKWNWQIVSLCRAGDADRAPRLQLSASRIGAHAVISDLDDSPTLAPLSPDLHEIKDRISKLVERNFDLVFTHGEKGEYTRHERHEQVHRAVRDMIESDDISGKTVFFAYDDSGGTCPPRPAPDAEVLLDLLPSEFEEKQNIVRDIYGFGSDSFELNASGPVEAFKVYQDATASNRLQNLFENFD